MHDINGGEKTRMKKKIVLIRAAGLIAAVCLVLSPLCSQRAAAGLADVSEALEDQLVTGQTPYQLWWQLPLYCFGFAFVTEGTNNMPLERQLRNFFPLDMDLTIMPVLGFEGDKLIIKLVDEGGQSDRLGAVALAQYESEIRPFWGTLYSSPTQSSFEIVIPVFQPGTIIYLMSYYMVPSTSADPYKYSITVSYPQ